jgi:hypothetical protein
MALWMLERMQESETFLADVRAARADGSHDPLDRPEFVEPHREQLRKLFADGDDDDAVDVPAGTAAKLEALAARDLRSGPEDVIEKALAAFLEKNPNLARDVGVLEPTTVELARAEIEGRISGAFRPGFMADLAGAARAKMAREREEREQDRGRE